MKQLILFDIDGTILTTHGAAREAFRRALVEVYADTGPIDTHPFDGKTDPQIARELLRLAGRSDAEIEGGFEAFWPAYLRNLEEEFGRPGYTTRVLPGVRQLLDALAARGDAVLLGLLTGNIAGGARLKLASVGLDGYFRLGAYGSDCEERPGLPAVAVERARALTGRHFRGPEVVVIGDTPHDITCGRALGVRAVGVTTGRYDSRALSEVGADLVLTDLSDTDGVLAALLAGDPAN